MFMLKPVPAAVVALTLMTTGCGGGSDSPDMTSQTLTGIFVDSAVQNIGYRTESQQGDTNDAGEFQYLEGEEVTFFIGDLVLPPVAAKSVVTPLDIAKSEDVSDPVVVNIARLLQSLDADGDPSNGIQIPATAAAAAAPVNFSLPVADFAALAQVINLVANSGSVTTSLISELDAVNHLSDTIDQLGNAIVGSWSVTHEGSTIVFTFFADGRYVHAEDGLADDGGQTGMERGEYTWNVVNGTFVSECPVVDTNGEWGLSHPDPDEGCTGTAATVTVAGDSLQMVMPDDEVISFERVVSATSPIVGAWTGSNGEGSTIVMTFLADGRYVHVEDGTDDASGGDGMERGTYTWDAGTGAFSSTCPVVDTNGEWGLSHPDPDTCTGSTLTMLVSGDTLTFDMGDEDPFVLQRVAP